MIMSYWIFSKNKTLNSKKYFKKRLFFCTATFMMVTTLLETVSSLICYKYEVAANPYTVYPTVFTLLLR